MYVTTARNPSKLSRRLARNLANLLGCIYETRGKKSFEDVVKKADALGSECIIFVHERYGNPGVLRSVKLDLLRGWLFYEKVFVIQSFSKEKIKDRFIANIIDEDTKNFFCIKERLDFNLIVDYNKKEKSLIFKDTDNLKTIYWIKGEYVKSNIGNKTFKEIH